MRFLLKALFFLAVVAAFVPREPMTDRAAPIAPATPAPVMDVTDGAQTLTGALCGRQPALCQTAGESAAAARLVGGMAVDMAMTHARNAADTPGDTPDETPGETARTAAP